MIAVVVSQNMRINGCAVVVISRDLSKPPPKGFIEAGLELVEGIVKEVKDGHR